MTALGTSLRRALGVVAGVPIGIAVLNVLRPSTATLALVVPPGLGVGAERAMKFDPLRRRQREAVRLQAEAVATADRLTAHLTILLDRPTAPVSRT